jgi:hypothetical protein
MKGNVMGTKSGALIMAGLLVNSVCSFGEPTVEETIHIDQVWSPVRVGCDLLTEENRQYIAYYNAERRTVIGMRNLSAPSFTTFVLPSESDKPPRQSNNASTIQGWDSHNYLTLAVDDDGYIHFSGNMHASPLLYFRSQKPHDVRSMKQIKSMTGKNEDRCTYPKFMTLKDGTLLFHYRDGGSGRGNEIYNVYDPESKTWRRFLDTPLLDGEGKMNAYQRGPELGPDGWYHLVWMWRNTPDAATNHDISYARSKDLRNWFNAASEPLTLPITFSSPGVIIDPVPVNGGMINSCFSFGFDATDRLVVAYHKHDQNGNTQAYAARFMNDGWLVKPVSDWTGKHIFKGGGSGPSTYGTSIGLGVPTMHGDGKMALSYRHWKAGSGLLIFDATTLERIGHEPPPPAKNRHPKALTRVQSEFPGMQVRWCNSRGDGSGTSTFYALRWESLGSHRDRPREKPWPQNSDLVLYRFSNENP